MTSDAQLLAAARDDPDAFRALYDRYAARVHGWFASRTRDADAAMDLTAETFAQAWFVRERFEDRAGGSAGPWLFGIARNVLLMSVRRGRLESQARDRLGLRERLDQRVASAVPGPEWTERADDAEALLDGLPENQREAVRLRVIDELDYPAVAAALRTTPQAARVRVHRGLATLRARALSTPTIQENHR